MDPPDDRFPAASRWAYQPIVTAPVPLYPKPVKEGERIFDKGGGEAVLEKLFISFSEFTDILFYAMVKSEKLRGSK